MLVLIFAYTSAPASPSHLRHPSPPPPRPPAHAHTHTRPILGVLPHPPHPSLSRAAAQLARADAYASGGVVGISASTSSAVVWPRANTVYASVTVFSIHFV